MKLKTTKDIGDFGERIAANYLRLRGYTVKERNFRAGKNEIDIIAATWREIVFVEVKTRIYKNAEDAETLPPPKIAVDADKQYHTRRCAIDYLKEHPTKKPPRMDVIEILLINTPKKPKVFSVHHIKGAY